MHLTRRMSTYKDKLSKQKGDFTFSLVELFTTSTNRGKALEVAKYSIAGS